MIVTSPQWEKSDYDSSSSYVIAYYVSYRLISEADAGEDGIVVGGGAWGVLAVGCWRPVAVGADGVGIDVGGGADEDVVDARGGVVAGAEAVEGAILGEA